MFVEMTTVQPIRHLVLDLAGKVIREEAFTEQERRTLDDFKRAFPDLQNPVSISWTGGHNPSYGVVVFPDELLMDVQPIHVDEHGRWTCDLCGSGNNITIKEVPVLSNR